MSLKGIISISGKGGLFKVIGQGKNNVIVQDIDTGRKFPAFASNKISALEDISIYTIEEDVLLTKVYNKMFAKLDGKAALKHKADIKELRAFLLDILPDYDEERVNDGDIRKLFQWYNLLLKADVLKAEDKLETEDKKGSSEEE